MIEFETRQDSIFRTWVKCPYCKHWIPGWGYSIFSPHEITTAEDEWANYERIVLWCRWCRKIMDKAVVLWKEGKHDDAESLASNLSPQLHKIFRGKCAQ